MRRKQVIALTEAIEHFLLYPEKPLEETLSEGVEANLVNQISRLEQQLLVERAAAFRREREITAFIENMAHQMNNTLTALQIQQDLLERHVTGEGRQSLQKSQECMGRLTGEIDKILKSSQLAAGSIRMVFESLELHEELTALSERLQPIARDRAVTVKVNVTDAVNLSADPFWLPQALENILKNAIEHSPGGGTVTVTLRDEGRHARIRVEDEGPGIRELATLFDRFHRDDDRKSGYGIGLSMARDIIIAHHGTIEARNRPDKGAVFDITLPVLDGVSPYID